MTMNQHVTYTQQEQDALLWEQAYETHFLRIYNYFYYQFYDTELAQDLTAECFMDAWKSRKRYDANKGAYTTWLFAIARQKKSRYTRKHRIPQIELTSSIPDNFPSPIELAEDNFEKNRVTLLVHDLPEKEREIIILRYVVGLSGREIAEMLVLSDSNVRKIISRAVQKLREKWDVT